MSIKYKLNNCLIFLFSLQIIISVHSISPADLNYFSIVQNLCRDANLTFFKHSLIKTTSNNQIQVFGITAKSSEKQYDAYVGSPAILVTGAMHPRQHTSFTFIKAQYSKGNQQVKFILDGMVLLVIPFVNIDAIKYSFTIKQKDKLRKNMNIKTSSKCRKVQDKGVDINRNFDYNFATQFTSADPCSQQYHGIAPFSQPQSSSILQIFQHFNLTTAIDVHSYGNVWIYPYASDTNPKKIQSNPLYPHYSYLFKTFQKYNIKYANCYQSLNYVADGVYIDWALQQRSVSFALQFGDDFTVQGKELSKQVQGFMQVLKINGIIFQEYLAAQPILSSNANQNVMSLCIKSLSMQPLSFILKINSQKIETIKLNPRQQSCFGYDFNKLQKLSKQISQLPQNEFKPALNIQLKIQNTNFVYPITLHTTVKKQKPKSQQISHMKIFLQQLKMFLLVVGGLCLLSSICGLSIFCQKSLYNKAHEQQKIALSDKEIVVDLKEQQPQGSAAVFKDTKIIRQTQSNMSQQQCNQQ